MAIQTDVLVSITAKDAATKVLNGIGGSFSSLRSTINSNSLAITSAITGAAVGIGALAKSSIDATSNLEESINAVQVTFGKAGQAILDFGKTASTEVGLSMRQLNEAATPLGAMLQNVGISAEESATKTVDLTKRAADLASVFNVELDEALVAVQAGLRGQTEPLTKFGVGLFDANVKQYALAQGIIETDREMTNQEKTVARLGLFFEQTNRVQGDFKNTSDSLANQQRILKAEFENVRVEIGNELLPIMRDHVLPFMRDQLIPFIREHVVPNLKAFFSGIEVVTGAWDKMTDKIADVMIWLDRVNNKLEETKNSGGFKGFLAGLVLPDGHQFGGMIAPGQPSVVGESGPEVVEPLMPSRVVPNTQGGGMRTGGGGTEINLSVSIGMYAGSEIEKRNIARELYDALGRVAKSQNKTVADLMGA